MGTCKSPSGHLKKIVILFFLLSACPLSYTQTMNGTTSFSDYVFIPPQGWSLQNNQDHLSIFQGQAPGQGCLILVIPPQPASGNLETDAASVFEMMYKGWNYRNTGEKKFNLIKGLTAQGLPYCMVETQMSKMSADGSRYEGFEDGVALVIGTRNKTGIISVRHNTSLMAHNDCLNKYETWLRFFNSIQIRNAVPANPAGEPVSKRIIGIWTLMGNGAASGEYIFAANGNYQLAGGVGTSTTSADDRYEYLHLSTYAFKGDGSYSIQGNQLHLKKAGVTEIARFRFDKINHGGSGWNERIHLLKVDPSTQKEYEVCYEKKIK